MKCMLLPHVSRTPALKFEFAGQCCQLPIYIFVGKAIQQVKLQKPSTSGKLQVRHRHVSGHLGHLCHNLTIPV